jgi:hypothetical protein
MPIPIRDLLFTPLARLGILVLVVLILTSTVARADVTWQVASGDWSVASNWGGALPTANDYAYISNGGTVNVTQVGESCLVLDIGVNSGLSGNLQMSGGSLGSNYGELVGDSGTGSFSQTGGTNSGSDVILGNTIGSVGTYNLAGGNLTALYQGESVGQAGIGSFTQSGGNNNTISPSGQIAPGDAPGTLTVSGSLVVATGASLNYLLDTPTTSDLILAGALTLNGQQFSDFNFTPTAIFAPGTYDLIEAGSITGTLGTSTSGTVDGLQSSITVSGDNLVLTVVPEPSAFALLGLGTLGLAAYGLRRIRTKCRGAVQGCRQIDSTSDIS